MDTCSRSALGWRFWPQAPEAATGSVLCPGGLPSPPSCTPPSIASPVHSLHRALVWGGPDSDTPGEEHSGAAWTGRGTGFLCSHTPGEPQALSFISQVVTGHPGAQHSWPRRDSGFFYQQKGTQEAGPGRDSVGGWIGMRFGAGHLPTGSASVHNGDSPCHSTHSGIGWGECSSCPSWQSPREFLGDSTDPAVEPATSPQKSWPLNSPGEVGSDRS